MKKFLFLITSILAAIFANGQCSDVSISVSASDTMYCQLYHAGYFLIDSGYANVCYWEVNTMAGAVAHRDTTQGEFADQSFMTFNHDVPLTDSMHVTLNIINEVAGISCFISDTLTWQTEEILPGSFIGDWKIIGTNGGMQDSLVTGQKVISEILKPSFVPFPADRSFIIEGINQDFDLMIISLNGSAVLRNQRVATNQAIDVADLSEGLYLARIVPINNRESIIKKLIIKH